MFNDKSVTSKILLLSCTKNAKWMYFPQMCAAHIPAKELALRLATSDNATPPVKSPYDVAGISLKTV